MEKFTWQDKRWLKYISRDNWQSGSELQEQIDALKMVEMMFEYKEISKETIAKKKKELQAAMLQQRRVASQTGAKKQLQARDKAGQRNREKGKKKGAMYDKSGKMYVAPQKKTYQHVVTGHQR